METFLNQLKVQFQLPLQNPVLVFALILLIILLSPILLRKLRVPGIIGLILAGIVVGPFGLNLLAKNDAVDLFSTIGILYLMFIAGLELEIKEFKKNSRRSLGFGALTFLLPILLGFPACYYILDYDFTASILLASMFSAHTMIAYPIVTKYGISKDEAVAITVGGTILTDTAVLLVLAVITGSHNGDMNTGFWVRIFVSMTIFLLIMFLLVPYIAKWFFIRLEAEKTSHYVFVMAIVFLAAFLSQLAGLEPIIGAFVAGLVLNRLLPPSSALMNRIQFVGNALFIPFFLISVGMLIDLRSLFHGSAVLVTALIIISIALVSKYIAARITQKIFHYSHTQGLLIFGLSTSRVAATMAVVLVGYKAGIVGKTVLEATILLILVSCLVAAIVTERAAKKMITETESAPGKPAEITSVRESILIPVAFLLNLEPLLELAQYIHDKKSLEPIRVLSVVPEDDDADFRMTRVRNDMEKAIAATGFHDLKTIAVVTADQNVSAGINRISRDQDATTILLGWPMKETFSDKLFGQKTEHIVDSSAKYIFLCRLLKPMNTFKRIALFCPPLSELEPGFDYLIRKVFLLSAELGCPISLYSNTKTRNSINSLSERLYGRSMKQFEFRKWEYFDLLLRKLSNDDISVIFSSRKNSVSHHPAMDHLVERLNTSYSDNTVILAYPIADQGDDKYDKYRDFYSEPLTRSMETFRGFQRGLGKMIHKAE